MTTIKANPDATNSELDAKVIIQQPRDPSLTDSQRNELIDQYVELVVDNMDTKTMMEWITDQLSYNLRNDYTDEELKEEVNNFDEELYDELVDNVTNETVLDTNNTGGKY